MNTLLKELLARGYTIEKEDRYHSNATVIRGYGHEFGFRIREPSVMVQRMDTFYHRMRTEYDPSGRIHLEVEGFGSWAPKVVRDGKRLTIEDRIGDLPAQMLKAIDAARRKKAEWEAGERRREAERQLTEVRPLPEGVRQEAADWIEWTTGVADAYDPLATWAEQLPGRVHKPR